MTNGDALSARPVDSDELEVGRVYFFLSYLDPKQLHPMLEPMVFVGRNLEPGEVGQVWFQDYGSFVREHGSSSGDVPGPTQSGVSDAEESGAYYSGSELELGHVFVYERALEALAGCGRRRRAAGM